jgi:Fur family ferric uptake transcriptional regulator
MQRKSYETAAKRALCGYLTDCTERPQSAEQIRAALIAAGHSVGQSTVYRILGDLCTEGRVKKYRADQSGEGFVYQYVGAHRNCESHLHLQCVRCGALRHLECDYNAQLAKHLLSEHGFALDCGRSVLYGLCAACAGGEA